jgi:anion transporter
MKTSKLSIIGTLIATFTGITIGITMPWIGDLSVVGHQIIMIVLITVGLWIFRPFGISFSLSAFFMMTAFLVIGIPMGYVFSGFTSGAVWTLIPALLFGHVIIKTGLGKRIALLLLKQFKPSYRTLIVIFSVVGIILSILTPSITVRISVLLPVALSCIEVCDLKGNSKEGALLLLTSVIVALVPGTGWLTGSLYGPVTFGMFESVPQLQGVLTFNSWAMVNLLPALLITLLVIVGGYLVFKPKNKLNVSTDSFVKKYDDLGKTTLHEKKAVVVLSICFLLFLTGGFELHPFPVPAIVLGGVFVLAITGVVKQGDISSGVNWDTVIFIGSTMGLIMVFGEMGIASWVGELLIPLIAPISGSPWLFVYITTIVFFIWRFVDIATLVLTKAILIPVLPLISQELGINPLIWVPIFIMAGNTFFLIYTNPFVLLGKTVVGENGWSSKQGNTFGLIYGVVCLIVIAICIPYWMAIGVL